jgi:MoaA/NifB/PqqE/SkfB family radical SAM enzyme
MQATLSIQPSPSATLGRQQNFLDMVSKILAPSNRSQLGAFLRGEALDAFRPVTVTLDPTLNCNARCAGCIERTPMSMARRRSIPWVRMQALIPELRALGVRAIELYGGEPTYYPWFADLLRLICDQGLHLAVVTNGSLLYRHLDVLQEVRSCLSWLRISINAGTAETHRGTFRFANSDAFGLIFETAECLADRGLPVGFSYVVTRRNYEEIGPCARLCERVRSSYLELKPAVHPDSKQLLPLPARIRRAVRDQRKKGLDILFQMCYTVYTVRQL